MLINAYIFIPSIKLLLLVADKVQDQLESGKPQPIIEEVDLASLWDLRRDVAKKLEKLEKRTQRAIAELIRMYKFS